MAISSGRACIALAGLLLCGCAATGSAPSRLSRSALALPLITVDGQAIDLALTLRRHGATVLVFWATRCPCVRRYQRRIEALRRRFPSDRVAMLAVASNADDNALTLKAYAQARNRRFPPPFPIVLDAGGRLARAVGARTTPTTVVLDPRGLIVFHGWIDNEREPGQAGRRAYAERAIEATLAGRRLSTSRTPVYGCLITRHIGEAPRCRKALGERTGRTASCH